MGIQGTAIHKNTYGCAIDEYGGTAGLIQLNLIEEIVGNIFDEYDEDEKFENWTRIPVL